MKNKLPKSLAAAADLYYLTRQKRLEEQKKVDEIRKFEAELQEYLIDNLSADTTGIAGKVSLAKVVTSKEPIFEDKDKFIKHLKKTGNFSLIQSPRLSASAIKELWEDNQKVPGVGYMLVKKISSTKL